MSEPGKPTSRADETPSAASHDRRETCGTRAREEVIIQPKMAQEARCTTNFNPDLDGESALVVCSSVECANQPPYLSPRRLKRCISCRNFSLETIEDD